jgi:methanogenic corrinoid protein MtbC1
MLVKEKTMDDNGNVILDLDLFAQTTELFERKKSSFAAEVLQGLAHSVISKAVSLTASTPVGDKYIAPAERLELFCTHLLNDDPDAALALIQKERRDGLSARDIYFGYISGSAQRLGRMWEEDEASFSQVTSASGYLYALMRALRPVGRDATPGAPGRKHALFCTVPGENHSLGVSMAADLFRRQGWDIDLKLGLSHNELLDRIAVGKPEIVGLSFSNPERLSDLTQLCVSIRLSLPHTLIVVAGPGVVDPDQLQQVTDVDMVFTDVDEAEQQLARLMHMRGRD